jgi:single-stranded DNA-binding protein
VSARLLLSVNTELRPESTRYLRINLGIAWPICGQFLTKGQLVDVEGRLQTRQWDDDAGNSERSSQPVVRRQGQELGEVVGQDELVEDLGGTGPGRVRET